MTMELSEVNTEVDIDSLRSDVDDLINELTEWGAVCEGIVQQLGDVSGALDAPDWKGAVSDALANIRLLDWSSPKPMEFLLPGKLAEIEEQFGTLVIDIKAASNADEEEAVPSSHALSEASTEALWEELGRRL